MNPQTLAEVPEHPLCWPDGQERSAERLQNPFKVSLARAHSELDEEMRRWRAVDWIISRSPVYRRSQSDPGVALWWAPRGLANGLRVLACDRYQLAEANLRAIGLTLSALRGCDRWGAYTADQAVEGARPLALPPPATVLRRPWWEVLLVTPNTSLVVSEAAYRALAKERQGDRDRMIELNLAIEEARTSRG